MNKVYDASPDHGDPARGARRRANLHRPRGTPVRRSQFRRLDPPAAGRTRRLLAGQVPCRTGRYPQGAQLPRNIGFGAGNAHLVQRPVDRSVGRRQLDRRDRHLLSGSYLHQGQILDRDQGERQIRLQPHQGRPRRRRGRGRHLVQESGRILGTDRPCRSTSRKTGPTARCSNSAPSSPTATRPARSRRRSTARAPSCRRAISTCRSV